MIKRQVTAYVCERCEHLWVPRNRNTKPKVCPGCKSPYWDIPKKLERDQATSQQTSDSTTDLSLLDHD